MFETVYAHVEQALVASYGIGPTDVLRIRSRLGALQRGGLLATRPGSGRKMVYRPDQFYRLIFAMELCELDIAPSTILQIVEEFWDKLSAIFAEAESAITRPSEDGDICLAIIGMAELMPERRAFVTFATARDLAALMQAAMRDTPHPARVIIVNLTARLRRFHSALADAHPLHWKPPTAKSKRKRLRTRKR